MRSLMISSFRCPRSAALPLYNISNQHFHTRDIKLLPSPTTGLEYMSTALQRLTYYRNHLNHLNQNMAAANNFYSIVAGVGAGTGTHCKVHPSLDVILMFLRTFGTYAPRNREYQVFWHDIATEGFSISTDSLLSKANCGIRPGGH